MNYMIITLAFLLTNSVYSKDFTSKNKEVINNIIWAADLAEVPRELVLSVCYLESTFRVKGVTHLDGSTVSHGICQVKLETAKFLDKLYKHKIKATPERLETTKINAFYAAKFIKYQLSRYDDNWKLAVDAYNKGTAVSESSKYVTQFIKSLNFIRNNIKSEVIYARSKVKEL